MGMVPKAGGYKRLRLVSFGSITSFWKEQNLSLPLPLPERIQWKRRCPPLLLEDPYRLHQTHNGLRLVRILYGSIPQNLQGMISLYGLTWDSWQSFFYVNNGDVFQLVSEQHVKSLRNSTIHIQLLNDYFRYYYYPVHFFIHLFIYLKSHL